jgi:hypothetical protein
MTLDFKIATSWNDLNDWQLKKIASIIFSQEENKVQSFLLVAYLFIVKPTFKNVFKFFRLLRQVRFSELKEYASFLYVETDLTKFSKKVNGLYGPDDRLANISVNEFSYADVFYYRWAKERHIHDLNRMVSVLYRPKRKDLEVKKDIRKPFIKEELKYHSAIVEQMPREVKLTIAMAFQGTREKLSERYPHVFRKGSGSGKYVPFTKIINSMSRSENQPFGDFYKTGEANMYDFLDVLEEELIVQKKREKNAKSKK